MKFDIFSWNEVPPNAQTQSPKGILRVLCSEESPLYLEAEGVEVLAGVGTSFDLDLSEAVTWRIEAPEGVRVFVYSPPLTTSQPDDEVYTNIDRMPHESGAMAEVARATRMLEIQRRSMMAEIRAEAAAIRASMQPDLELIETDPDPAPVLEAEAQE